MKREDSSLNLTFYLSSLGNSRSGASQSSSLLTLSRFFPLSVHPSVQGALPPSHVHRGGLRGRLRQAFTPPRLTQMDRNDHTGRMRDVGTLWGICICVTTHYTVPATFSDVHWCVCSSQETTTSRKMLSHFTHPTYLSHCVFQSVCFMPVAVCRTVVVRERDERCFQRGDDPFTKRTEEKGLLFLAPVLHQDLRGESLHSFMSVEGLRPKLSLVII